MHFECDVWRIIANMSTKYREAVKRKRKKNNEEGNNRMENEESKIEIGIHKRDRRIEGERVAQWRIRSKHKVFGWQPAFVILCHISNDNKIRMAPFLLARHTLDDGDHENMNGKHRTTRTFATHKNQTHTFKLSNLNSFRSAAKAAAANEKQYRKFIWENEAKFPVALATRECGAKLCTRIFVWFARAIRIGAWFTTVREIWINKVLTIYLVSEPEVWCDQRNEWRNHHNKAESQKRRCNQRAESHIWHRIHLQKT